MGVTSDLVIAVQDDVLGILECDDPLLNYQGFTFAGMDNIRLATLLSLIHSGAPETEYDIWLEALPLVGELGEHGPWVYALNRDAVAGLSRVAIMDSDEFERLAEAWKGTEEFSGWLREDIIELLRLIGDTADTAMLNNSGLVLRTAL